MEKITILLIAGTLMAGLIRLMLLPVRLVWKLLLNGLCGVFSLYLLNLTAGLTGFSIPVNPVTATLVGFLGLPGIVLLGILQFLL